MIYLYTPKDNKIICTEYCTISYSFVNDKVLHESQERVFTIVYSYKDGDVKPNALTDILNQFLENKIIVAESDVNFAITELKCNADDIVKINSIDTSYFIKTLYTIFTQLVNVEIESIHIVTQQII